MADTLDSAARSRLMARIRGKDTGPELLVRRALHARRFRYRLHDRRLPGRPDLVLPKHRAAVFVHGCFWHGHACGLCRLPRSNQPYWRAKIDRNRARDAEVRRELRRAGWRCLVIWECALRGPQRRDFDKCLAGVEAWLRGTGAAKTVRGTPPRA